MVSLVRLDVRPDVLPRPGIGGETQHEFGTRSCIAGGKQQLRCCVSNRFGVRTSGGGDDRQTSREGFNNAVAKTLDRRRRNHQSCAAHEGVDVVDESVERNAVGYPQLGRQGTSEFRCEPSPATTSRHPERSKPASAQARRATSVDFSRSSLCATKHDLLGVEAERPNWHAVADRARVRGDTDAT